MSYDSDEIIEYPFHHSIYKVFTDDINKKILEEIKKISLNNYKLRKDKRYTIVFYGDSQNGINYDFTYPKINEHLKNNLFLNKILNFYFKNICINTFNKYNSKPRDNLKISLEIVCDPRKYTIGPHTDGKFRNCTIITYFLEKPKRLLIFLDLGGH